MQTRNESRRAMALAMAADKNVREMADELADRMAEASAKEGGTTRDAIVSAWIAGFVEGAHAMEGRTR